MTKPRELLRDADDEDRETARDPQHPDNLSVEAFADAMKVKLWRKRHFEGRGGWDKPDECSVDHLWTLLLEHVAKGPETPNMVDIANFAMMIWNRRQWETLGSIRWPDEYTR